MLFKEGRIEAHAELLKKYRPSMLELLKIQGLGPKTIALIWSAHQVSDLEGVEKLAREGKIRELPRMGEKHELKLLKAIEDYRRIAGTIPARYRGTAGRKTRGTFAGNTGHRKSYARRIAAPRT